MEAKTKTATKTRIFAGWKIKGFMFLMIVLLTSGTKLSAHCDSYDGPVIKDALAALEKNNVNLVLKWISASQEEEIKSLFNKTWKLRSGDKEIYSIVEKHFLETLVRLHRETEGATFTGLKAAGTTKHIIKLSDSSIEKKNIDGLLRDLSNYTAEVIGEKYNKVIELEKVKNESPEKGREYVKAYIDFTHSLEAIHDILDRKEGDAHMH